MSHFLSLLVDVLWGILDVFLCWTGYSRPHEDRSIVGESEMDRQARFWGNVIGCVLAFALLAGLAWKFFIK